MEIVTLKIVSLKPYEKNAKTHPKKQVDLLAENITRFGFTTPVLVDKDNNVIAGHGRLLALKQLGKTEVPCVRMEHLSDEEVKALRLADNKIAELGEWDMDLAIEELKGLDEDLLDLTGFDSDLIIEPDEKDDEVPDVPEKPVSVLGDLYELGSHRVLCGDSTKIEDVERLMDGKKADMVFTDPPYNQQQTGGRNDVIGKAFGKQTESIIDMIDFNPTDFLGMLPILFSKNTLNALVFTSKDLLPDYLMWAKVAGYSFNVLVWKKPNAIPIGGSYRPDVEYLLIFRKSAIFNSGLDGVSYSKVIENKRETGLHPTMKPVDIITNQIKISSHYGSLIVDAFLGSGSTLIASEKTGRICYGMELDPKYVDVIVQRYVEYTGNATIKKNGQDIIWETTKK